MFFPIFFSGKRMSWQICCDWWWV